MPDFFSDEEEKFKQDPQVEMVKYLKQIYEETRRMSEDLNRIKLDVDKIAVKIK